MEWVACPWFRLLPSYVQFDSIEHAVLIQWVQLLWCKTEGDSWACVGEVNRFIWRRLVRKLCNCLFNLSSPALHTSAQILHTVHQLQSFTDIQYVTDITFFVWLDGFVTSTVSWKQLSRCFHVFSVMFQGADYWSCCQSPATSVIVVVICLCEPLNRRQEALQCWAVD